jgi:crotonobetainyl-CoA:carnitine CoA-transferase CaiB-like acyl-CoA transferase
VLLAVGTERQFRQLCIVLNLENLLENPDFQTNAARVQNRERLVVILAAPISKMTLNDLMTFFSTNGVPAARIRDMQSVFEMPEAQAMILEETTAEGIETKRLRTVAFKAESHTFAPLEKQR